jgi:DtxR family Mn-dependent transcriptional regulator
MDLTARVEDYLEAILEVEMTGEAATVTKIAANLGVTKATVTAALKRLKIEGLLEHERYGDVELTDEGREKALTVYRRHEFLADFFMRILGFSRDRAQNVSCVMEHEIDEQTERRLAAFTDSLAHAERANEEWFRKLQESLDSPKALPVPLCMMPDGSSGAVARLTAQYELRRRLNSAGFVPDAFVSGIQKQEGAPGGLFTFTMNEIQIRVGITEASAIWLYQPEAV